MISLNDHHAVFNGAACTAASFQYFDELLQFFIIEGNTQNNRYGFALAPFDLPAYPYHTVVYMRGLFFAGFILFADAF